MRHKRGWGEGLVYQRKDGRWVAALSLGAGMRKSVYRQTKAEALIALYEARQVQMQGTLTGTREETVETYLSKWLQYQVHPNVRQRTYETYQQTVEHHLLPTLGSIKLQKLTPWHLRRLYHLKRRQQCAPSTIQRIHRVLSHALNDALKPGHVAQNVCLSVELPAERKRQSKVQALTVEQARQVLEAARNDPWEALCVLALTTGMRQGELLALKWSDLDVTYGKLQVRRTLIKVRDGKATLAEPKSPTSRRCIQLTDLALEALKRHAVRQRATSSSGKLREWVFCDKHGVPLRAGYVVRHSFEPLLARAEVPRIRFHDLRRSTATLLLTLGVHPKIVQELLGHSEIFVTLDVYSHILPTLQEEAMHRLNGLLAPAKGEGSV